MKTHHVESEPSHLLIDLPQPEKGGLLKTGFFSLLFHIVLISFLILNLKTGITKGDSPVYRVTIQPLRFQTNTNPHPPQALPPPQPIPAKTQIQKKEENTPKEEVKQSEPVEEPKQLPQHQEDEQTIQKPIPLPMAETSTLNTDTNLEKEEIPPISAALSSEEKDKNTLSESNGGEGTGTGSGGSTLGGSGKGEGAGGGGPRWIGIGEGTGMGQGGSHWVSSGDGSGMGRGSGKGTGTGRGGGRGGFGQGGSGGSRPRYIENPKPDYPLEARNKGYEGKVLLQVEVLLNGRVGDIFVKESSGYEVLDQSALDTVKKWRFIPAKKGEVPIPCWVNVPITFQLRDISF
jgi:TonB family protein